MKSAVRNLMILAVAVAALTGCGGGGGANGSSSTPTGSVTLSLSTQHVTITGVNGLNGVQPTVNPSNIAATISNGSGTYYGAAVVSSGPVTASFFISGNQSGDVQINLLPGTVGGGTAQVVIEVCGDQACTNVFTAQTVAVEYSIYTLSPSTVQTFSAVNGPTQTITVAIDPAPPAQFFTVSSTFPWLSGHQAGNSLAMVINPSGLAQGPTAGALMLNTQYGTLTAGATLNVSNSPLFTPVSLTVTPTSTEANSGQTITPISPVSQWGGSTWNASSNAPWLVVQTSSGAAQSVCDYTINPAALPAGLGVGQSVTGQIVFSSPGGYPDEPLQVTVTNQ